MHLLTALLPLVHHLLFLTLRSFRRVRDFGILTLQVPKLVFGECNDVFLREADVLVSEGASLCITILSKSHVRELYSI